MNIIHFELFPIYHLLIVAVLVCVLGHQKPKIDNSILTWKADPHHRGGCN